MSVEHSDYPLQRGDVALGGDWYPRFGSYIPAAIMVVIMSFAWLIVAPTGGMASWGVSARALAEGRHEILVLHIFAHGGVFHLIMNSAALLEIGGLVVARLGGFPRGWIRFLIAIASTAMSGAILFLSVNPGGQVPLIGASGAVYGLLGLLLFVRLSEELDPVPRRNYPKALVAFVSNNRLFLLILLIGAVLSGVSNRMSWEAHAGGFLLGACLGPWLSPPLVTEASPLHTSASV